MKIGIDARFVGPQGTGLGKYTEKLVLNLSKIDPKNQYAIFLKKDNWDYLALSKNFKKVLADVPWYSLEEQLKMPGIFKSQNLDILHVPHFNVPIFYRGKFVVTIHDLIHHEFSETSVTTKNPLIFSLKRIAYRKVIGHAIHKSQKIITPSNFVKSEIARNFKIDQSKIVVTYEAAEEEYFSRQPLAVSRQPFLLYVGNAYPHKNLERLLDALEMINSYSSSERSESRSSEQARTIINLILVCPRDVFSKRLLSEIRKRDLEKSVELKGYLGPEELSKLFQKAAAYIFPSLSEGFGIPGLNAMASNLPLLASAIPVLKEVYGDAALYFDPKNPNDIARKIEEFSKSPKLKSDLIKKGKRKVKKYSWLKMAHQTLSIYKNY
ncbi:glycosyltransferase family 4 protein [Candidatus Curtissbacteria bacterium]|nr:glycosyltransferase family 4 protein [Candidatus Curtissbacteria bacterium]